jgi:uncharacterized protein YbjT (DUF2867 family)
MMVIIGGFGRIGRIVSEHVQRSAAVRLVSRDPRRSVPAGAELAVARLHDEAELGRALRGARAAFVLLPDDFAAADFRAERRAMVDAMSRALRQEAVPRVVLLSSTPAALGERGENGFGAELSYFERRLSDSSAVLTILRASYFQDNVAQLLPSVAESGSFPNFWPGMKVRLATVAVADVAAFAAQALLRPSAARREVVDVLGPEYSPLEMAQAAATALQREVRLVDVPREAQEQSFGRWMQPEAARAMVQTLRCLASPRSLTHGDRAVRGETQMAQLLARQVRS